MNKYGVFYLIVMAVAIITGICGILFTDLMIMKILALFLVMYPTFDLTSKGTIVWMCIKEMEEMENELKNWDDDDEEDKQVNNNLLDFFIKICYNKIKKDKKENYILWQ